MEALLAGDFDDDDDDDDDSFDEDDKDEEDDDDDDDDDDEDAPEESAAAVGPSITSRLPLHQGACNGMVEALTAVLEEGAKSGYVVIGKLPDGSSRTTPRATSARAAATASP